MPETRLSSFNNFWIDESLIWLLSIYELNLSNIQRFKLVNVWFTFNNSEISFAPASPILFLPILIFVICFLIEFIKYTEI